MAHNPNRGNADSTVRQIVCWKRRNEDICKKKLTAMRFAVEEKCYVKRMRVKSTEQYVRVKLATLPVMTGRIDGRQDGPSGKVVCRGLKMLSDRR